MRTYNTLARLRVATVVSFLLALLGACEFAGAQEAPAPVFIEAQRAEARGEYGRAESLYNQAVTQDSANTAALFGRARMRSWLGRFPEAIRDYQTGIERDPNDPQALSGLAWTYAWSHHFDEARTGFEHLAKIEPYYLDAQKGLAYVALWRGHAHDARRQFEELARQDQGNPDYVLAIGQAAYLEGDLPAARAAFGEVLQLKPDLEAARSGLRAAEMARIERSPALTLLASRSESGDVTHSGLRYAQLAMQVTRDVRLWVIHDRGVGFDEFSLDRRTLDASTTTAGGFFNYTPRLAARFEAGVRRLPDETQKVVTAEQVFFLSGNTIPKVGVWWAHGSQNNQWVLDASLYRRLNGRFSLEPTVYLGDDGTYRERRGALLATYTNPARMQFGLGLALGSKDTADGSRSVTRVFGNASVPLGKRATFLFYGWREGTKGFPYQTVLAAGVTAYL
jgi:tetratricopeptide (TPR) repeat protein